MTKFVCSVIVLIVVATCSQARDTLYAKCQDVCGIIYDFMQEDPSVEPFILEWLEENGYSSEKWDCEQLRNVLKDVVKEFIKAKEEMDEKEFVEFSEQMKDAATEMAGPMMNAIMSGVSKECKNKWKDIWSQVM